MGRLFWKFFLSILLAQVAATIGIGGALWLRDQSRQNAAPTLDTGPSAEMMVDVATVALKYGGEPGLREMIATFRRRPLYVLDAAGRDLLGRDIGDDLRAQVEQELQGAPPGKGVRRLVAADGTRYLAFVPRRKAGPAPGPGARSPGPGYRLGRTTGIVAAVLASLLFAALLAWYFSRPIRALRSAFEAAAAGNLAPRFAGAKGGDELSDLGRDFDQMSAQLRALMEGQRRLLHDVSHELRSPLARLQAAVGLAHQQPDKIGASLERIERESVRMDKLVGELLTLSRLEGARETPLTETIELDELLGQIADDARFEAGQSGTDIVLDVGVEAAVRGAPDLLWSAIENVVRNAIKHGGQGGKVDITLRVAGRAARIDVCDRGPGIGPGEIDSIFQPFFRAQAGRGPVDGHGLGLAIAQRVISAHRGTIEAANRSGGGLCVTITLPLATQAADPARGRTARAA